MHYCTNGITLLPVKTGEPFRPFQAGLNPAVHCLTVTAPLELDTRGKWMDCELLMDCAVMQAEALVNRGAVLSSHSSSVGTD